MAPKALLVLKQQDKIRNLCVTKIKLVWVKVKHTHVWKKCQLQHFEWNSVKSNKSAETSLGGFLPSTTMTGITKLCQRNMSNFSVLDQQISDSNSKELHIPKPILFPIFNQDTSILFYWARFLLWMKNHNFWTNVDNFCHSASAVQQSQNFTSLTRQSKFWQGSQGIIV